MHQADTHPNHVKVVLNIAGVNCTKSDFLFCRMKRLRQLSLCNICDDDILQVVGQSCPLLQMLDVSGSKNVTDFGIQNLIFPPTITKAAKINLSNTRARTSQVAKILQVEEHNLISTKGSVQR